jgi:hypothetical protein
MGFLNDLFGDEAARDRAMAQGFEQYRDSMSTYLTEFEDRFLNTIADVQAAEQADISALQEAFARQTQIFDDMMLNRAGAISEAGRQRSALEGQQAGALSDVRRAYTTSISGLQTSLAERMLQGGENIAEGGFETAMGRAQNIGTGFNLGGALVGAGLSLATGGIANSLGIPMGGDN